MKTTSLEPLEDRVLIRPDVPPEEINGLIVPDTSKEKLTPPRGTVVAAGPGMPHKLFNDKPVGYLVDGVFKKTLEEGEIGQILYSTVTMPVKVGQKVLYSRNAGLPVSDPDTNETFLVMRATDLWVRDFREDKSL
jgi:co-chaperonin GroES (HSP10)